jgi:GT2 family glycosyltransferase
LDGGVDLAMKISVVTTLRNAVETIGDCLDSVAAQTHAQREHIVMDGASEDSSLAAGAHAPGRGQQPLAAYGGAQVLGG